MYQNLTDIHSMIFFGIMIIPAIYLALITLYFKIMLK